MKIEKHDQGYQIILSHDELLTIVNGLGARQFMAREIACIIAAGDKRKTKELEQIHRSLAAPLPAETW